MMWHGRRASAGCAQPLLPCNGCSRYHTAFSHSWCENIAEHNIIAERKINTFCIAMPVVACSLCLLSTGAHQYGKATRTLKLQPQLFMLYLALACSQVSLRMYGRPKRERCCIGKCHARENTFYEGSLLRRGIWLTHNLNKLQETHSKTQVTGAVGTQHQGEEQEKGTQGLTETPEDWIQKT